MGRRLRGAPERGRWAPYHLGAPTGTIVKPFIIVLSAALLSACTHTSGVVPIGSDIYMISRSEKGFDTTGSRVKADALKEANEYCAAHGKTIEIVKTTEKDMVPFKSDAQAEVEFRCTSDK